MIRPLSAAFLFAAVSCAPSPRFEGREISSLEMRFEGERTVDDARLRKMMKSQPGTLYSTTQLDDDIRTLYEDGFIDDMVFDAKPDGEAVGLIATVRTSTEFGPTRISGNKSFHHERLAREAGFRKSTPITRRTVEKARRTLEKFYHRQDYPDAKVFTQFHKNEKGGSPEIDDFHFVIEEGAKR